jgi:flavin-dependent dehydrogenase
MNNQSEIHNSKSKVVIAGAGPAGSSLAIRLADKGFEVVLIERDKFPRQKLCGEFISPESLSHFRELDVLDAMLVVGGDRIERTSFFAPSGRSVTVSSEWFGDSGGALSISRAAMDSILLERARAAGVEVIEETHVFGLELENGSVRQLRAKSADGNRFEIGGDLFVDATGRSGQLGKLAVKSKTEDPRPKIDSRLIGFKAHLENVRLERGNCEIYFFDGGYGGLSFIEGGLANHCFLVRADRFKASGSVGELLETVVFRNRRAADAMRGSRPVFDWLAVSVDGFGKKRIRAAENLFSVGDAAAFIDPFTGSGMLMALESSAVFAESIGRRKCDSIASDFAARYDQKFTRRLRFCSVLRTAAFWPRASSLLIGALGTSGGLVERLARATRSFPNNPKPRQS